MKRPILRGRDICRYSYHWANLWLIYLPWHFPLQFDETIQGASEKAEQEFQRQYPTLYSYMLIHKEKLSKRNKTETGIRYEWYALQRWGANYWGDFMKPCKIVYSETNNSSKTKIALDESFYMTDKTCFILLTKEEKILRHIYKIMSSTLFTWYMQRTSSLLGTGGILMTKESVITFPMAKYSTNSVQEDYQLTQAEIDYIEDRAN